MRHRNLLYYYYYELACVVKLTLQDGSLGRITLPNSGVLFTLPESFLEAGTCFLVSVSCSGYIDVLT